MRIEKTLSIESSAKPVWELLGGSQFGNVAQWSSDVHQSSGSVEDGRSCETSLGMFKERVTRFDEERQVISYRAEGSKMPFFVKRLENNWHVSTTRDPARCAVHMRMEADLMFPFNILMTPILKMKFRTILDRSLEELKHFVEKGQPHPRKVATVGVQLFAI